MLTKGPQAEYNPGHPGRQAQPEETICNFVIPGGPTGDGSWRQVCDPLYVPIKELTGYPLPPGAVMRMNADGTPVVVQRASGIEGEPPRLYMVFEVCRSEWRGD